MYGKANQIIEVIEEDGHIWMVSKGNQDEWCWQQIGCQACQGVWYESIYKEIAFFEVKNEQKREIITLLQ